MTLNPDVLKDFEQQGYRFTGEHSAVKICTWTKKSLRNQGCCFKEKFYGIKSHRCCQMTCSVLNCQNNCIHCWRNLKHSSPLSIKDCSDPASIIENSIKEQRKILMGFKGNSQVDKKKFAEAMEPNQFAISLTGEATLYSRLPELIALLKKKKSTVFLVTNGLNPTMLLRMEKADALPTQIYISLNSPRKEDYIKWHKSHLKDAWQRFNKSLTIMNRLRKKTRTALRMTLVRNLNMSDETIKPYSKLIRKASPDFLEIKGYMAVGYAGERLDYASMPTWREVQSFALKMASELNLIVLGRHELSRVVLLGPKESKAKLKIDRNYH